MYSYILNLKLLNDIYQIIRKKLKSKKQNKILKIF